MIPVNLKQELQELNNQLDKCRSKLAAAEQRDDKSVVLRSQREIAKINKLIADRKGKQSRELSVKGGQVKALAFHRALSTAEQADLGQLKKRINGLVVVHPLTALGRELGLTQVTGYAPKAF